MKENDHESPTVAERASSFVKSNNSEHREKMICHARKSLILGVLSIGLGALSVKYAGKARDAYCRHRQWQTIDTKLDQALEDTGTTSESVSIY